MTDPRQAIVAAVAVLSGVVWLVFVPVVVVETFASLVAFGLVVAGASLTVGRTGMVDLSAGAVVGVGAYAGGVTVATSSVPPVAGLLIGGLAGAVFGGLVGGVIGRVGRLGGALASLALGVAAVAVLEVWPGAGGASGFHAVPLLTGDVRGDLALTTVMLVVALAVSARVAASRTTSRAAVAVASPTVATSLGVHPAASVASVAAIAGALIGAGGAALASSTGSVLPASFGLPLTAAVLAAGLLGGAPPWGPLLGVLVVWGVPLLATQLPGDTSALLLGGVVGLVGLGLRGGRPLRPWPVPSVSPAEGRPAPRTPRRGGEASLTVETTTLSGDHLAVEVEPGQILALVGPNGSGKSTLLAQIGGQLPDHGGVQLRGRPAPRGARRRATLGIARTWQRADLAVPTADADHAAVADPDDLAAYRSARALLGGRGTGEWLRLAARRPAVALLDEPGASHPPAVVRAFLRHLAAQGTAVVIAEHRPETVAVADQVVRLEREPVDE